MATLGNYGAALGGMAKEAITGTAKGFVGGLKGAMMSEAPGLAGAYAFGKDLNKRANSYAKMPAGGKAPSAGTSSASSPLGGFAQAVLEPAVSWILSGLGMESNSYIKKFVVSFLTKKEGFWNYLKDCRTLTKGIAESLAEAVAIQVQQGTGTGGFWMDSIRNVLGDYLSKTEFVQSIEKQIGDKICGYWDKATGNAKNVLSKLKGDESKQPQLATTTPTTAPTTQTTAVSPTNS